MVLSREISDLGTEAHHGHSRPGDVNFGSRLQRRISRDPNKFPTAQLALLALIRVAEPIAITSIFPYAWQLVLDFKVGDPADASFYAGILISAFNLAEAISGVFWGGVSDRWGRRPVLFIGCFGTILTLLTIGFSVNFWMTLAGRIVGGALNGNVGVIQTMVAEIVVNPAHEPKAYAVMPFVWSVGIIVGPAVGGYFASPAESFPGSFLDIPLFRRFPYALPNLICASLMLVSIVIGYLTLEETHPDMQPWSTKEDLEHTDTVTPYSAQGSTQYQAVNLERPETYGTFTEVNEDVGEEWNLRRDGTSRPPSLKGNSGRVFTKRIMMLMLALGIFTYHSMTYDHLMPIFFQDERVPGVHTNSSPLTTKNGAFGNQNGSFAGGLGLSVKQCGIILAVNGVIALFVQAVIFPFAASQLGVWRSFLMTAILHPIAYFIVPWLVLLPPSLLYPGIYTCLVVRNLMSILAYPLLLILIKEASTSSSCLGKINGLSASTGAACRTIASPIAGLLYSMGDKTDFTPMAWWASALVAVIGAFQAFSITNQIKGPHYQVRPVAPCRFMPNDEGLVNTVKIRVYDSPDSASVDENTPLMTSP
ncbi:MFS general substrate transporter [Piedraia hortae CBS 480.64]|uniref:MFS general substrate transporter n=1 Tax=Piedraia hortae CBS 480.64 TaxID=1314780 RepID=A0A6A7BZY2_9PEZI|nr:MFS general substrate transporter [Piedraia hortae CBS 480.64]